MSWLLDSDPRPMRAWVSPTGPAGSVGALPVERIPVGNPEWYRRAVLRSATRLER